jgi:methylenetetrahydrofolate reductase (NADPH)
VSASETIAPRAALAAAVRDVGYEVLPFSGTLENVVAHVPRSIPLTVTASPQKGIDATVALSIALAEAGYAVTPHLSARMIDGPTRLDGLLDRVQQAGIDRLFVVGGDGEPSGAYADAGELLEAIAHTGRRFERIGIGGYPEGHAAIPDAALEGALRAKSARADYITTQICFAPATITRWAEGLARDGIALPVKVGIPGAVSRQKLLRITGSIGIGDSAKFLRRQKNLFWRFFLPGGYSPDALVAGLGPALASTSLVSGFHVFTFNDLAGAERWRARMLQRYPLPS